MLTKPCEPAVSDISPASLIFLSGEGSTCLTYAARAPGPMVSFYQDSNRKLYEHMMVTPSEKILSSFAEINDFLYFGVENSRC